MPGLEQGSPSARRPSGSNTAVRQLGGQDTGCAAVYPGQDTVHAKKARAGQRVITGMRPIGVAAKDRYAGDQIFDSVRRNKPATCAWQRSQAPSELGHRGVVAWHHANPIDRGMVVDQGAHEIALHVCYRAGGAFRSIARSTSVNDVPAGCA